LDQTEIARQIRIESQMVLFVIASAPFTR